MHLVYDCPERILQIAPVANKYPTLIILKGLETSDWESIALR